MDGLFIRRDGQQIALEAGTATDGLRLMAKAGGVEVMRQKVSTSATMWITPAEDKDTVEIFYVLSGAVELNIETGSLRLVCGDSFYVDGLKEEVRMQATEPTELLYITNRPLFDSLFGFQDDLMNLVRRIDEKDNYTYRHSRDVMEYSVGIVRRAHLEGSVLMDNIVIGSLFHDVGKCFVPDEVLKSRSALDAAGTRYIYRHPVDGGRLLAPHYDARVVEIVRSHHERLDGSGYPMGITGEEISMEARIVAAADCFDAMTTDRGYNKPKDFVEAAQELAQETGKFDGRVTAALLEMARDGTAQRLSQKVREGACENEGPDHTKAKGSQIMKKLEKYRYWMMLSDYDLDTIDVLVEGKRWVYVAYLCQQAVERQLKGMYVYYLNSEAPKTHNINFLFSKLLALEEFPDIGTHEDVEERREQCEDFLIEAMFYYMSDYPFSYKNIMNRFVDEDIALDLYASTKDMIAWLRAFQPGPEVEIGDEDDSEDE